MIFFPLHPMWLRYYVEVACFVTGLFLIGLAIRNLIKASASRRWPQVPGRIIRSFVYVEKDPEGGQSYTPKVEYEYVFEGTTYRGTRLRYDQIGSWNRPQAERVIAAYPPGTNVPVFVNPQQPNEAVLTSGLSSGNLVIAAAGIVFLAVAASLVR